MTASSDCDRCGHSFDPHALFALDDPAYGGVILCPVPGCPCYATWAPGRGAPPPDLEHLPDRFQVEALRERLQSGAL